MAIEIHPTAIVEDGAEIGAGCRIGPFAIIESGARIGLGNEINANCHIFGSVRMGNRNRLMRAASLGGEPQSLGYKGEDTRLEVGSDNWFGENTVIHRGTPATGVTRVGNHLYMMNGCHLGHDVVVGDKVIMAPEVMVGGEAVVNDRANIGGGVAIHQFVRIGELVMVGGLTAVTQDVLPFTKIAGNGNLFGLNSIGIKRSGQYTQKLDALKDMYRRFCINRQPLQEFQAWLAAHPEDPFVQSWREFLSVPTKRGYARGRARGKTGE